MTKCVVIISPRVPAISLPWLEFTGKPSSLKYRQCLRGVFFYNNLYISLSGQAASALLHTAVVQSIVSETYHMTKRPPRHSWAVRGLTRDQLASLQPPSRSRPPVRFSSGTTRLLSCTRSCLSHSTRECCIRNHVVWCLRAIPSVFDRGKKKY